MEPEEILTALDIGASSEPNLQKHLQKQHVFRFRTARAGGLKDKAGGSNCSHAADKPRAQVADVRRRKAEGQALHAAVHVEVGE